MSETLYATYVDPNRARQAANELMSMGVKPEEISLLVKRNEQVKNSEGGVDLENTRTTVPLSGTDFFTADDPMGDTMRQLSVPRIERGVNVELNPAQNDYPIAEPDPRGLSSAPADASRDYNPGIEDDDYNKDYRSEVSDDIGRDRLHDERRKKEAIEATPYEDMPNPNDSLRFSRGFNAISEDSPETIKVDPDADGYRDGDPQLKADHGVNQVAQGAAQGAGIGFGLGAATALVTLLIPGLGLVIGGGALAIAAGALAAGTGLGAVAGGIAGVLKQQGLPEETINRFSSTFDHGGAILAVTVTKPELRDAVESALRHNGAQQVETHQAYLA